MFGDGRAPTHSIVHREDDRRDGVFPVVIAKHDMSIAN